MNKFDLIFLLLGEPSSKHVKSFLELYDSAFTAGFHTTVATSPSDLAHTGRRLRIIVIDAYELKLDDVLTMKACFPNLKDVHLIFLTGTQTTTDMLFENGVATEVNICLPLSIGFKGLLGIVSALSR